MLQGKNSTERWQKQGKRGKEKQEKTDEKAKDIYRKNAEAFHYTDTEDRKRREFL